MKIGLVGNPNVGKTTLFNMLTGSNQKIGNWPGVTIEKKEGNLKKYPNIELIDLPGIYSLSPYSEEEKVARDFLENSDVDLIINIVDINNLSRNLYLTMQLLELNKPVILALNMEDIAEYSVDTQKLAALFNIEVCHISALKKNGIDDLINLIINSQINKLPKPMNFESDLEKIIKRIVLDFKLTNRSEAIKMIEDHSIMAYTKDSCYLAIINQIQKVIKQYDDGETMIATQRYQYLNKLLPNIYLKKHEHKISFTDKLDNILLNKWLAIPIFMLIMYGVYYVSVGVLGTQITDWTNDVFFGEYIIGGANNIMNTLHVSGWLKGLVVDGIISGVGAVLGFVPQLLILFLMLTILEECGYMSRVAFILDRAFRKFGLNGKMFIPMLIGTGCSVPAIMATRTIENEKDRNISAIITSFMPCSAKLPIIALISGALFHNSSLIAFSAYVVGITAIIISGIILNKIGIFKGDNGVFIMELPDYHFPEIKYVFKNTWNRGKSFIKKAGTIILLSSIVIWFLTNFGYINGTITMVSDFEKGFLADLGRIFAPVFKPLGFGTWKFIVATFTGLVAKENVVGTMGIVYGFSSVGENGNEIWNLMAHDIMPLASYSFLLFNLLCAPCFAAIGAMKRELSDTKKTIFAITYQCVFAYIISFIVYQLGMTLIGHGFNLMTIIALLLLGYLLYWIFIKKRKEV